jgi:hypothetical protein
MDRSAGSFKGADLDGSAQIVSRSSGCRIWFIRFVSTVASHFRSTPISGHSQSTSAGLKHANNGNHLFYSTTSSARPSSELSTVRPSVIPAGVDVGILERSESRHSKLLSACLKRAITGCTNSRRYRLIRIRVLPSRALQERATHSELFARAAVTLAALVHPDRRARRAPATFHQAAWPR